MRSVPDHQALVASLLPATGTEEVPIGAAAGRVLATDVLAAEPLPAFDNSAMDGYAVRGNDLTGAGPETPVRLPVAADVPAGAGAPHPLAGGTAQRIMTGAPVPPGADTVVPVEETDGGREVVALRTAPEPGTHVRRRGSDLDVGGLALAAGSELGAAQLGLLAALGLTSVSVRELLRVLVLSTGSELVGPGEPVGPGQIRDANGPMLAEAVRAAGAIAVRHLFVDDAVDGFLETLGASVPEADVVITSGGVSAGDYEVVKLALAGRGVEFTKVAMQPGMPQGAGAVLDTPVVCLPGNPVSSLVSFEVFVRPALRAAMGHQRPGRAVHRVPITESVRSIPTKRQFRRGRLSADGSSVQPWGPPASAFLHWLAQSDCLIDLPVGVGEVSAGDVVEVWDLTS